MALLTPRPTYAPFEYDQAYKYWELQQQSHWLQSEIAMASDINDWKLVLNEAERQVIGHILKGFTQSEVFIQEYWGQMVGKWFKKPEIQMMAAAFSSMECFDDKTELLTSKGWLPVTSVTSSTKVAQYNITSKEISFDYPTNVVSYRYKGEMHLYKNSTVDLCVTPNHDLIVTHPTSRKTFKAKSESGVWGRNYLSPVSGMSAQESDDLSDIERLLIAIQADGCIRASCPKSNKTWRTVDFDLTKERKQLRLKELFTRAGIEFSERPSKDGFSRIYTCNFPGDTDLLSIKDFSCFSLESFSAVKAKSFIEEVVLWDSTQRTNSPNFSYTYYNSNKKAVDFVQAVGLLCGISAHIGINRTEEQTTKVVLPNGTNPKTAKTSYAVSITEKNLRTLPNREDVSYDGYVYCVSVPEQNVISRRNDRVLFTGNSIHASAYAYLNQSLGIEDFEAFLYEPTAKAKIDRLIQTKGKSKMEIARSLAIFSAFNEGVSLFSSFAILLNFSRFNKLKGVGQIIAFSIKDESLHSDAGCWLFRTLISEYPEVLTDELKSELYNAARVTVDLEDAFIDKAFSLGTVEGLTAHDVKCFIRFRANTKLNDIGLKKIWKNIDKEALVRMEWFDVMSAGTSHGDFFASRVNSYSKGNIDFSKIWGNENE